LYQPKHSAPEAQVDDQWHFKWWNATKDTAEEMLDVHAICVSPAAPESPFVAPRMGLFRAEVRGSARTDLNTGQHAAHLRYGRDVVVVAWDPTTLFARVADASRGVAGRCRRESCSRPRPTK
jgi:hypothetical protein